jgi:hypothetical protein
MVRRRYEAKINTASVTIPVITKPPIKNRQKSPPGTARAL